MHQLILIDTFCSSAVDGGFRWETLTWHTYSIVCKRLDEHRCRSRVSPVIDYFCWKRTSQLNYEQPKIHIEWTYYLQHQLNLAAMLRKIWVRWDASTQTGGILNLISAWCRLRLAILSSWRPNLVWLHQVWERCLPSPDLIPLSLLQHSQLAFQSTVRGQEPHSHVGFEFSLRTLPQDGIILQLPTLYRSISEVFLLYHIRGHVMVGTQGFQHVDVSATNTKIPGLNYWSNWWECRSHMYDHGEGFTSQNSFWRNQK